MAAPAVLLRRADAPCSAPCCCALLPRRVHEPTAPFLSPSVRVCSHAAVCTCSESIPLRLRWESSSSMCSAAPQRPRNPPRAAKAHFLPTCCRKATRSGSRRHPPMWGSSAQRSPLAHTRSAVLRKRRCPFRRDFGEISMVLRAEITVVCVHLSERCVQVAAECRLGIAVSSCCV